MKKLAIAIGLALTISMDAKQLTPEVLWSMGRIGSYDISADGKNVVYGVSYYSKEDNKSRSVVKLTSLNNTGATAVLTDEGSSMYSPRYMKNGTKISYLAADVDGVTQLWMMNVDGSERTQISFFDRDVDDYSFSPDGLRVIVVHQLKSDIAVRQNAKDISKASGMVVGDLNYRHWDEWVTTMPHPFVADVIDGRISKEEKDLLDGTYFECPMKPFGGIEQLAWSPDSRQIAYTCRKLTGRDYATSTDSDIYLYDIITGRTRNLCKPEGYVRPAVDYSLSFRDQAVNHQEGDLNMGYDINPKFSANGRFVAWQSMEHDGYESDRNRLCIYELATGRKFYVTEQFDSNVDDYCWANDSKTLYFVGVWHGETHVYATNLKGDVRKITEGQYDYTSVVPCAGQLLCSRQSMKESPELFLVNPKKGSVQQVTFENQKFRDEVEWGDVIPHWSRTTDGKDLLSWIVLPPHFDASRKYPTLLFCEGGPQSPVSQFWSYRWNMMIMAANGYVVVAPNRRGLPGFGSKWNEDISTNYGGQCMDDYLSAIDDACSTLSYIDRDRLGCVGASFGGFSVYWLAGHHNRRFKCFIAHDGIYNLEQQYVETEEAWFTNWDLGGAPWHLNGNTNATAEQREAIRRSYAASPHRFVDKWDTPILCIHGEKDFRIVASQAMAAFNAAKYRGIEAELLICPDENHWVLKPQNGILWQRTYFEWLDRWLKD